MHVLLVLAFIVNVAMFDVILFWVERLCSYYFTDLFSGTYKWARLTGPASVHTFSFAVSQYHLVDEFFRLRVACDPIDPL